MNEYTSEYLCFKCGKFGVFMPVSGQIKTKSRDSSTLSPVPNPSPAFTGLIEVLLPGDQVYSPLLILSPPTVNMEFLFHSHWLWHGLWSPDSPFLLLPDTFKARITVYFCLKVLSNDPSE